MVAAEGKVRGCAVSSVAEFSPGQFVVVFVQPFGFRPDHPSKNPGRRDGRRGHSPCDERALKDVAKRWRIDYNHCARANGLGCVRGSPAAYG